MTRDVIARYNAAISMKTVALVTYKTSPALTPSDALLVEPLKKEHIHIIPTPWDDPAINWAQFDAIALRSCWNYHTKYKEFIDWTLQLDKLHAHVLNTTEIIRWNSEKTYLLDLEGRGASVVPTIIIKQNEKFSLKDILSKTGWSDIVIKPSIGADADGVFKVSQHEYESGEKKFQNIVQHNTVLIQPLMTEVMTDGEYSIVFLDGIYSHCVKKIPKKGEFRSNYQFGNTERLVELSDNLLRQAYTIVRLVTPLPFYARVDGIIRNGEFVLMELELIEPHLFINFFPPAAIAFARALKALLQ